MKKIIENIRDAIDDKLRWLCALLTPENRLVVILVLLLLGAVLNTYFMFSTIRNWNKPKVEPIERIEPAVIGSGKRNWENQEDYYDYEEELDEED